MSCGCFGCKIRASLWLGRLAGFSCVKFKCPAKFKTCYVSVLASLTLAFMLMIAFLCNLLDMSGIQGRVMLVFYVIDSINLVSSSLFVILGVFQTNKKVDSYQMLAQIGQDSKLYGLKDAFSLHDLYSIRKRAYLHAVLILIIMLLQAAYVLQHILTQNTALSKTFMTVFFIRAEISCLGDIVVMVFCMQFSLNSRLFRTMIDQLYKKLHTEMNKVLAPDKRHSQRNIYEDIFQEFEANEQSNSTILRHRGKVESPNNKNDLDEVAIFEEDIHYFDDSSQEDNAVRRPVLILRETTDKSIQENHVVIVDAKVPKIPRTNNLIPDGILTQTDNFVKENISSSRDLSPTIEKQHIEEDQSNSNSPNLPMKKRNSSSKQPTAGSELERKPKSYKNHARNSLSKHPKPCKTMKSLLNIQWRKLKISQDTKQREEIEPNDVLPISIIQIDKESIYVEEPELLVQVFCRMRKFYGRILKSLEVMNGALNPLLLLQMAVLIVCLVLNAYLVVQFLITDEENSMFYLSLTRLVVHAVSVLYLLTSSENLYRTIHKILAYIMRYPLTKLSIVELIQIELLYKRLYFNPPMFTASGVFNLSSSILGSISSAIITYVLVALQFKAVLNKPGSSNGTDLL